jgi:hypothetical protein
LFAELAAAPDDGLTSPEAMLRLARYGGNDTATDGDADDLRCAHAPQALFASGPHVGVVWRLRPRP